MLFCALRSSLPSMRQQLAVLIRQRPAGRAGIVGHRVEHVDRTVIGRFERAAAGIEPRLDRDDAVLHAGRLVAGGHAEQIAEGQHPAARFGRHAGGQIEIAASPWPRS